VLVTVHTVAPALVHLITRAPPVEFKIVQHSIASVVAPVVDSDFPACIEAAEQTLDECEKSVSRPRRPETQDASPSETFPWTKLCRYIVGARATVAYEQKGGQRMEKIMV
jgi:hypothetical protein